MTALLLIDFQNDFFPFGTVEVQGVDATLVALANRLMHQFDHVIALCDEHPGDHVSFAANHLWRRPWQSMRWQEKEILLWPMHCVAGSFGAEMAPGLNTERIEHTFAKGIDPDASGYSGFENKALEPWLRQAGINRLVLMGALLEYSVKYTALDARAHGFEVSVIHKGYGSLELHPADVEQTWSVLAENGVLQEHMH